MLGAIIGDMVGSVYEFKPIKRKDFEIFDHRMRMTDDSLLTIAVAKTLLKHYPIQYNEESLKAIQKDLVKEFVSTWRKNIGAGLGALKRPKEKLSHITHMVMVARCAFLL